VDGCVDMTSVLDDVQSNGRTSSAERALVVFWLCSSEKQAAQGAEKGHHVIPLSCRIRAVSKINNKAPSVEHKEQKTDFLSKIIWKIEDIP